MKKYVSFALVIVLSIALLTACSGSDSTPASGGVLSSFTTTDLDGNAIDQSILADAKLTMVNVWATYCSPCLSEMPDLAALADEVAADGVQIIGMVSDVLAMGGGADPDTVALAQDIAAQTGADYLHIVPSEDLYSLMNQITAVPTTFFVDANGAQVGSVYLGARDHDQWAAIIAETLELVQQ